MNVEQMVLAYRKIRDAKKVVDDNYKEEIRELNEQLDTITASLLEVCQAQNIDSLRTPAGTVTRKVTTRYWTSDWESMYKFIKDHDVPFLLEQRISNRNMQQFLEDNPDMHPEGLNTDSKYTVVVRKPTGE